MSSDKYNIQSDQDHQNQFNGESNESTNFDFKIAARIINSAEIFLINLLNTERKWIPLLAVIDASIENSHQKPMVTRIIIMADINNDNNHGNNGNQDLSDQLKFITDLFSQLNDRFRRIETENQDRIVTNEFINPNQNVDQFVSIPNPSDAYMNTQVLHQ